MADAMDDGHEQVDTIPSDMRAAAGAKGAGVMDKIWGTGDEEVATPAASTVETPAEPGGGAQPGTANNEVDVDSISQATGLPKSLVSQKLAAPVAKPADAAAAPDASVEAAEEAKAQQLAAALPEKAQREAFISLRQELKSHKQARRDAEAKLASLMKDLEAAKTQTGQAASGALEAMAAELKATKEQLSSMEAEIGRTNYEKSTEFREKYLLPQQSVKAKMARILETVGGKTKEEAANVVESLLRASPSERASVLDSEPMAVQGALLSAATDFDDVSENAKIAVDNWRNRKAAIDEEARRVHQMGFIKNLFEDTDKAVTSLQQEGNALFAKAGDPAWDKEVDERVAAVRGVIQTGDPAVLIKHIADGVSAPKWRELYWKLTAEYSKLKADASKVLRATPGVGGGDGAPASQAPAAAGKPKSAKGILDDIWGPDSL